MPVGLIHFGAGKPHFLRHFKDLLPFVLWNYTNTPAGYGNLSKVGSHSDWAADALRWAVDKGILENVPFTNATEQATRAQTAQMLTNYLRNS